MRPRSEPRRPMGLSRPAQLTLKYSADRLGAAALAVLTSPILGLCALAIKLDDGGPVLFRQVRLGLGARTFTIRKFRTMVTDADSLIDADGRPSGDRITRVGRFLRLTSLDELPQLLNIVEGEMSFIGPRPVLPEHWRRYTPEQRRRFEVKPGVTGLAQVAGRNTLRWSQRLLLDVEYVDRFSLALDARILVRTVQVVASGEGVVMDRNPHEVDDLPRGEDEAQVAGA